MTVCYVPIGLYKVACGRILPFEFAFKFPLEIPLRSLSIERVWNIHNNYYFCQSRNVID